MTNYFDSLLFCRWNMTVKQVTNIKAKLNNFKLTNMLILQLLFSGLFGIFSFIFLKNIMPNEVVSPSFLIYVISNIISGLIYVLGSYYFFKLFFKTDLSLTKFYLINIYLSLPILLMYVIISFISMILSFNYTTYISYVFILYFILLFYSFKVFNTYLYLFKIEFKTSSWKVFVVLLLWILIIGFISKQFNSLIL